MTLLQITQQFCFPGNIGVMGKPGITQNMRVTVRENRVAVARIGRSVTSLHLAPGWFLQFSLPVNSLCQIDFSHFVPCHSVASSDPFGP